MLSDKEANNKNELHINKGLVGVIVDKTSISGPDNNCKKLFFRGYDVNILAEKCDFLEVVYLLLDGALPTQKQFRKFKGLFFKNHELSREVKTIIRKFAKKAVVADIISVCLPYIKLQNGKISNYYDKKNDNYGDDKIIADIISSIFAIICETICTRRGKRPGLFLRNKSFADNFLNISLEKKDSKAAEYLNRLFILAADNGMGASTFIARGVISSGSSIYDAINAALDSYKGHAHGAAPADVIEMLEILRHEKDIDDWVKLQLKNKKKIPGFGHRLYKKGDPRHKSLYKGFELIDESGRGSIMGIIKCLIESVRMQKGLLPNSEIIAGPSLSAIGFDKDAIPMIIFMARCAGISAHLKEQMLDNKIIRPSSIYEGGYDRKFIPLDERT